MRISIVTPSFNQAQYIDQCLDSIRQQRYDDVEHWVIDGGSTDGTIDVLKRNEHILAGWVSEKDRGQAHALNKGFSRCTGDLIGWQNSDDYYLPGAFAAVAAAAAQNPSVDLFFADIQIVNGAGQPIGRSHFGHLSKDVLLYEGQRLANQAVFFRRRVIESFGGLDESYRFAMDYEFFVRVLQRGVATQFVPQLWGAFRLHDAAKTATIVDIGLREVAQVRRSYGVDLTRLDCRMKRWVLLLARAARMAAAGELSYVIRGIRRKLVGGNPADIEDPIYRWSVD